MVWVCGCVSAHKTHTYNFLRIAFIAILWRSRQRMTQKSLPGNHSWPRTSVTKAQNPLQFTVHKCKLGLNVHECVY